MASLLCLAFASLLLVSAVLGQASYGTGCGAALEDIPNPASDTCTAFFRCYRSRQYSLRCPLGQAFDFDKSRCRAERDVDCPLQLQRFQAPAVPSYLRPPGQQNQQEREIEIRVVQVPPGVDPTSLQIGGTAGRITPVNTNRGLANQFPSLLNTHTRTGFVQQQPAFPPQGQLPGQFPPSFLPGQSQAPLGQYPSVFPQSQSQVPLIKPQAPAPEAQPGQDGLNILAPGQGQAQEAPQ